MCRRTIRTDIVPDAPGERTSEFHTPVVADGLIPQRPRSLAVRGAVLDAGHRSIEWARPLAVRETGASNHWSGIIIQVNVALRPRFRDLKRGVWKSRHSTIRNVGRSTAEKCIRCLRRLCAEQALRTSVHRILIVRRILVVRSQDLLDRKCGVVTSCAQLVVGGELQAPPHQPFQRAVVANNRHAPKARTEPSRRRGRGHSDHQKLFTEEKHALFRPRCCQDKLGIPSRSMLGCALSRAPLT